MGYGLAVFAAALIALALSVETFGALMRSIGALNDRPAVGYSTHVRIATVGRIFTLVGTPAIGILVDRYNSSPLVLFAGAMTFLFASVLHACLFLLPVFFESMASRLFFAINGGRPDKMMIGVIKDKGGYTRLRFFSLLTISIQSGGLFFVNYFAATYPGYRATIVQMAGWLTFMGTVCHIFFVDPVLADGCDKRTDAKSVVFWYLNGRMLGSLINFVLITSLYFWLGGKCASL